MARRNHQRRYEEHPRKIQYIDGSAARQLDYYEDYYDDYYEQEERERRERSQRVRKNRKKARQWNLPYAMMLLAATMVTMVICAQYLQLQSSIINHKRSIAGLESSLVTIKQSNETAEKNLESGLDLNKIYEIATQQYGMVYPNDDQVIQYDKSESEYVRQYDEIPTQG